MSRWIEVGSNIVSIVTRRHRHSTPSTTLTTRNCTSSSSSSPTTRRRRCRPTSTVLRKTVHTTTRTGTRYAPCRATTTSSKASCCDASTAIVSRRWRSSQRSIATDPAHCLVILQSSAHGASIVCAQQLYYYRTCLQACEAGNRPC